MSYTITRQCQWPNGDNVVEISEGGIDYCNPDALVKKYDGEFETFADPRIAADKAIEICRQWRKDRPQDKPRVAAGATGGNTIPFDPCTFKDLRKWAKETWNRLEKCARCNEPLPGKRYRWHADDWSGLEYCSEYCATKEMEFQQEQEMEMSDDDN